MNTPNKITLSRICLIPLMVFFYLATFIPFGKVIGAIIFIVASCTDFVDGYLARKNNQVTDLGKFLDPIADKILVVAGLLLIVCDGSIPNPYGVIITIIIVAREFIVSAFRQIAATKGLVIAADKLGKWKTLTTDVAIVFFMIIGQNLVSHFLAGTGLVIFEVFSYILIAIATVLTIISGINYIVKNIKVLK